MSEEAARLIKYLASHPLDALYRLAVLLERDPMAIVRRDAHDLRNCVLSMNGEDARMYADEISFLREQPTDYLLLNAFLYPNRLPDTVPEMGVDKGLDLPYVMLTETKRLYFPKGMPLSEVSRQYHQLVEVEGLMGTGHLAKSPHCYVTDSFKVDEGDVLVDVGSAEGVFALWNAETASKLYLFEMLKSWIRPLRSTFAPYADKTTIVQKFVGDRSAGNVIRLADVLPDSQEATYFIKLDVEGNERMILESSRDFLCSHKVKVACCLYHRQDDERSLVELLQSYGFTTTLSDGYMLTPFGGIDYPYFRRGIVYARNYS